MDLDFLRPDAATREPEQWLTHHDEGELAVDVYETDKAIFVKTAIAGIKPEDLKLALTSDMLTIRGVRGDEDAEKEERQYLCRECHFGQFSRTVLLPCEVNALKAEATFKSGLLLIKLPKAKKGGEIKVKVEE